jgi:hypothetical protein
MGLKAKVTGKASGDFPVGITLVKVIDFKVHKDGTGAKVFNSKGDFGFIASFQSKEGQIIEEVFWYSPTATFWLQKMLQQIHLRESRKINFSEIIGNKLWLFVGRQYMNNDRVDNPNSWTPKIFNFEMYIEGGGKPAHKDDPDRVGGEAVGDFLIEFHKELKAMPMPQPISGPSKEFHSPGIEANNAFMNESSSTPEEVDEAFVDSF